MGVLDSRYTFFIPCQTESIEEHKRLRNVNSGKQSQRKVLKNIFLEKMRVHLLV
jgi:hypothetical protein